MANIKCYGCSFTKHGGKHWPTWVDFVRLSAKQDKIVNLGESGSSNEYICRTILMTAKKNDTVIVMWSSFDRVHQEKLFQKTGINTGKCNPDDTGTTMEQLFHRSLEYIWLANRYCNENKIKIINLNMTIFTIGETRQKNSFKEHLDVGYRHWPIDLSSFCLDHKPLVKIERDTHPTPSQQYKFAKSIVCPILKIDTVDIQEDKLFLLDNKAKAESDG